uniref:Uncharacterized protein n=1 Tax=Arundo donax TaxID=35708 RepID=A0A0A9BQM3_ARUDO
MSIYLGVNTVNLAKRSRVKNMDKSANPKKRGQICGLTPK